MPKTNPRLIQLRDEFASLQGGCRYLDDLAGIEKRDLTDAERASYDGACTRMEAIEADITTTLQRQERFDKVAAVTAGIVDNPAPVESTLTRGVPLGIVAVRERTAGQSVRELGEYCLTRGKVSLGKMTQEEGDEILKRNLAHGVSDDGTAPVTIEGDLIKFIDANRYAVNAVRRLPMPDNKAPTFLRPRSTQFTTVATQVTQGDVLSSRVFQNTGDTVTKVTKGGTLALSEQEVDWTDPAMLGLSIQDLAQQYAIDTDEELCDAIEAAAIDANETVLSLTASLADFVAGVASAAATVYGNAKRMADKLFVAIDRWAYIASLVDGDGRPAFPIAGPFNTAGMNAGGVATFSGMNVLGLEVVVDPNFATNFWAVGVSSLAEFYELDKGLLQIAAPSTLETIYAYRGYVATNVYSQGFSGFEAV